MINFNKIYTNLSLLHGSAQDVITPVELVKEVIDQFDDKDFKDPSAIFLDPVCGRGTFLVAIIEKLYNNLQSIIPDPNTRIRHIVENQIYGIDLHPGQVRTTMTTLKKLAGADVKLNIYKGDFMNISLPKKFNKIVGNPPYNISNKKTGNGTGGDVTLYKKFYKQAKKNIKANGEFSLITPKGIISVLEKEVLEVKSLNLMTEKNHWKYNTCYFHVKNIKNKQEIIVNDKIIKKIFAVKGNPNWYELNGKPNKNKITYKGENAVKAIIKLGTEKTKPIYGSVDPTWGKLLGKGPKLAATLLENNHSYLITEDPICAEFCGVYQTSTIEEAEKLKLFVDNSELFKKIHTRLKTKGLFWTLRHVKPFDLKQIETGNEVPKEWNLTDGELEELLK